MVQKMLDQMVYISLIDDEKITFLNEVKKSKLEDPTNELRKVRQKIRAGARRASIMPIVVPLDLSVRRQKYEYPAINPNKPADDEAPLDLSLRIYKRPGYIWLKKWPLKGAINPFLEDPTNELRKVRQKLKAG